jgi:hypothetical protein
MTTAAEKEPWHGTKSFSYATLVAIGINIVIVIWGAAEISTVTKALQVSDQRQWVEINRVKAQQVAASQTLGEIKANTERSAQQLDQITNFLLDFKRHQRRFNSHPNGD